MQEEFTTDDSDQEIEIEYISSISNLHPRDMNTPSISKDDLKMEADMGMEVEEEEDDEQSVERLVSNVCEELSEPKKELVFRVVKVNALLCLSPRASVQLVLPFLLYMT
jgi:hypothetical protein